MSSKRTAADSSSDEQSIEYPDLFQKEDDVKRAKLASMSDTTMQDLPNELLEDILVKAVATEVIGMKLAKRVWKKKADLVMNRLGTVSPQWKNILSNNYIRVKVHRILDSAEQKTICLQNVQESHPPSSALNVIALKEEIYLLSQQGSRDYSVTVCDRNNMKVVKDVIQLPGKKVLSIDSCSVSNCVFVLNRDQGCQCSVLRIARDANQQFNVSTLIGDLWLPRPTLSVTTNGNVIVSRQRGKTRAAIHIYCATTGSMVHELRVPSDISGISQILPKPNGNAIVVSLHQFCNMQKGQITEIDLYGNTLRRYSHTVIDGANVCLADTYGRILIIQSITDSIVLLDSEFNRLEFTRPQLHIPHVSSLRYNCERNEVVIFCDRGPMASFRITEN